MEFLVTAQAYEYNDKYKQTLLLHDTVITADKNSAKTEFEKKYKDNYFIIKIFSVVDIF